ncbi:TetR/AcrR family transcriptional regulator [Thermobifida halotolerans]|uniref:TetR/AcrR family transcriptional regulator n=1 Tax=Thermobifida halotolerans TaxID=483545 RepID=A0AA97LZ48_9ACTN|nr:TetR/AcrR family transcriptional regulator [Thermobifida halotolerans]UOE21012.1 TetR/AcrR family transcriptional regulator [Thermobifida halotolerans]
MAPRFGSPAPSCKGQATRDRILDALHELLDASPAARVSMADVAERAGLKRPSVYNHFRTVDEMCLALIDRSAAEVFHQGHTDNAADLGTYLSTAFVNVFCLWARHRVVFVMALEIYARDRTFARAWDQQVATRWIDKALPVYAADVEAGRLAPVPDPSAFLNHIALTTQHHFHRLWRDGVPTARRARTELGRCLTAVWRLFALPGQPPKVDRAAVDEALALACRPTTAPTT